MAGAGLAPRRPVRPGTFGGFAVGALVVVPFGFGFLLAQTAWNNAFLSALPAELVGVSAGISKAAAQTGTVLGTALLGALVLRYGQADFARRLGELGLSSDQIVLATNAVDVALRADLPLGSAGEAAIAPTVLLAQGLLAVYHESFTVGLAVALLWAAGACLGAAALAWLVLQAGGPALPHPSKRDAAQADAGGTG